MSDEVHVDTHELRKLGDAFTTCAYDLGRHLSAFRSRTDAEALSDAFGPADAPPASPGAELVRLSELMEMVIGRLQERLDDIGSAMKSSAEEIAAVEHRTATMIRGMQ